MEPRTEFDMCLRRGANYCKQLATLPFAIMPRWLVTVLPGFHLLPVTLIVRVIGPLQDGPWNFAPLSAVCVVCDSQWSCEPGASVTGPQQESDWDRAAAMLRGFGEGVRYGPPPGEM